LYQRSAYLGVPFNIASYALLTMMIAQVCDLEAGSLSILLETHTFTTIIRNNLNCNPENQNHYQNDFEPNHKDIFKFDFDDFTLKDMSPSLIKGNVSV
jgi:thymidylate synthase